MTVDVDQYSSRAPSNWVSLRLAAVAGLCSLLVYGYELFHFTLSIDEEVHSFSTDMDIAVHHISQGRWGMALLVGLLPPLGAMPFLSTLLFCVGLSLAAAVIAELTSDHPVEQIFFVALLVIFPTWPHLVEFNITAYGIGFGLLAISIAARLTFRSGVLSLVYSAALLAFATAVYQTLSLAYLVVVLMVTARQLSQPTIDRNEWQHRLRGAACRVGSILGMGALIYLSVSALTHRIVPSSNYVENYFAWRTLLATFRTSVMTTASVVGSIVGGQHPMYLGVGASFLVLGALGLWNLTITSIRDWKRFPAMPLGGLLLLFAAFLVAFLPEVVNVGHAPVRSLVPVPFFFALVASRGLFAIRVRAIQLALLGFAVLNGIWISNALFYSDAVARQRDAITATLLANRINEAARPFFSDRIPFLLVGNLPSSQDKVLRRVEVFGTSFFEHDGGNPWRVAYYLKLMGIDGLEALPITALVPISKEVQAMPTWPLPGSVSVIGGRLVVKFGHPSGAQGRELNAAPPAVAPQTGTVTGHSACSGPNLLVAKEKEEWRGEPFVVQLGKGREAEASLVGFNSREEWGAWTSRTIGEVVLPCLVGGRVRIKLFGWVLPGHSGTPVILSLGDVSRSIAVAETGSTQVLDFELRTPTDRIRVEFPTALSIGDSRELGIAIGYLAFDRN